MELGEFALNMVVELLGGAIQAGVSYTSLPYFTKRKINRRVEDATAEIVEPLMPFLTNERIPEDKQKRLIQACIEELRPFTDKPELLFQSSLNGQQIFDELYASRPLPQVIIEDGLKDIYTLIFPRIATLLCKIPSAVRDWESTAWAENFRRFDEISSQLRNLFSKVDQLANSSEKDTDDVLFTTRRMLAQKIGLELDLTGLRADNPRAGKFDNFFIHPTVSRTIEGKTKNDPVKRIFVNTPDESFQQFTKKKHAAVIVGSPGSGKSYFVIRHVITQHIAKGFTMFVYDFKFDDLS
ncbi:MAG: hypothetical protein ICV83_03410, partial [Cytophagales bacterium]|nr:hypothetical protein [Cytophagales bacterium]